jgi:hypothetical protein
MQNSKIGNKAVFYTDTDGEREKSPSKQRGNRNGKNIFRKIQ